MGSFPEKENTTMKVYNKFSIAVYLIFLCGIIVSFTDTIALYDSGGFGEQINLPFIQSERITLSLFATIMVEMAYTVGLWGLFESFRKNNKLKFENNKAVWFLFGGGLVMSGISNVGQSLGVSFLLKDPYKGLLLGLSVPYFVLCSVIVGFKAKQESEQMNTEHTNLQSEQDRTNNIEHAPNIERNEQTTEQSIQSEIEQPIIEQTLSTEQIKTEQTNEQNIQFKNEHRTTEQDSEQIENVQLNNENKQEQVNTENEHQNNVEQAKIYEMNNERTKRKSTKKDYAKEVAEQMKTEQPNQKIKVRELAERAGCSIGIASDALKELNEQIS